MFLKNIVTSNVFLYKIWFYSVLKKRNKQIKLPKAGDRFYFDGYPRSGNTYTIGLIESIYPNLRGKGSHHLHAIAGIKMAIKNNLKIVIMIRNPKDAIISYLYIKKELQLKNTNLIDELTNEYIAYNKFVLKYLNKIKVINFDVMIKNKKSSLQNIGKWLELDPAIDLDETIFDYESSMKNLEKVKNSEHSSLPNQERKNFKIENINDIINSKYYDNAVNLYNKIILLSA